MNIFYSLNYWENHKAKVKFAMKFKKILMHNFSSNPVTENLINFVIYSIEISTNIIRVEKYIF